MKDADVEVLSKRKRRNSFTSYMEMEIGVTA